MKLQWRFLILLLAVFVLVGASLSVQRAFDLQRSQRILSSELEQRKSLFTNYLDSEGRTFESLSVDYSFWDDMVSFIKTDDLNFAHENLDSGLSTFGADIDWVYRPNGTLLYDSTVDPSITAPVLPLPSAYFQQLTKAKFNHFYLQLPSGTLEIRGATIVPGDDPEHTSPPSGYWLIGRYLGGDFISSISTLSQSAIELEPPSASSSDVISTNTVSFATKLTDWEGTTVELLTSTSRVSVISDLDTIYQRELTLLIIISLVLIGLVSLAVWRLVLQPIRLLGLSIQKRQPELLNRMTSSRSQFGQLAQITQLSFQQRLLIEQEQFKKANLEKLNKEKTAFLAMAAHELKGPITVAKLLSDELSETFRGTANTSQLFSNLDIITNQVTRMVTLISDLRLASEGKESLSFKNVYFDFDLFLHKELVGLQLIINKRLNFEGSTGAQVFADPDRLSQVISNLVRNAAKYSPDAEQIIIRSSLQHGSVVVEVEDFGIGIGPEDQQKLFERYYRAPSVVNNFNGMGLGLSICKDIIDHSAGQIWVESSIGHGSHFYFSLPIATQPAGDVQMNTTRMPEQPSPSTQLSPSVGSRRGDEGRFS